MKTLKTFLEVRRPKSADERKFMDKHIVVKHADRNGNGDDLFNAKNIKTIKRDKEGHGYDTGKDAKVYEAKLDEAPIKLTPGWGDGGRSMRANKAKLAGKNLPKDDDTGTPDHFSAARRRKRGLDESTVLEYLEEMGIEVTEAEFNDLVDGLQEELLGELSKSTLKSYIPKALLDADHNERRGKNFLAYSKSKNPMLNSERNLDRAVKHSIKSVKRIKGVSKAAAKLANEELDELFSLTVEDLQEEILGELSNQTLKSYIKKAGASANNLDNTANILHNASKDSTWGKTRNDRQRDAAADHATKSVKRVNSIVRAAKKIKESNEELDELFSLTIEDLSDKNQALLTSLYESLDLENQINLVETLQEDGGLDQVLDFALESELKEL